MAVQPVALAFQREMKIAEHLPVLRLEQRLEPFRKRLGKHGLRAPQLRHAQQQPGERQQHQRGDAGEVRPPWLQLQDEALSGISGMAASIARPPAKGLSGERAQARQRRPLEQRPGSQPTREHHPEATKQRTESIAEALAHSRRA